MPEINYMDNRISKVEDNVYILHERLEELASVINLQKTMIDDLFQMMTKSAGESDI